jgi:hypothetical protein
MTRAAARLESGARAARESSIPLRADAARPDAIVSRVCLVPPAANAPVGAPNKLEQ